MAGGKQVATAFAPASIGNVGVGFDMLGLAVNGPGDRVTASRREGEKITIERITATELARGAEKLSMETEKNTAGIAVAALWRDHDPGFGVDLDIVKGIPLGSGMGGSATTAVAGVVAANALLPRPLAHAELLPYAIEGEKFASKALHADNVAPSLFGGLILCPARILPDVIALPIPSGLRSVLVHPDLTMNTSDARRALARECLLQTAIEQQGYMAAFVVGCYTNDRELIARSLRDVMIEPQRGPLVKGFDAVKAAAIAAGAIGCSLSGSGPSLFAWVDTPDANSVRDSMVAAFSDNGLRSDAWISELDSPGAGLVDS